MWTRFNSDKAKQVIFTDQHSFVIAHTFGRTPNVQITNTAHDVMDGFVNATASQVTVNFYVNEVLTQQSGTVLLT